MSHTEALEATTTPSRFRAFWVRHRTLLWTLHSVWALSTGVVVVLLARGRYGFVPWVVLFLALTWLSTLLISKGVLRAGDRSEAGYVPGAGEETASYVTRTMYQETLFFLLPFYAYSTVLDSLNVVFVLALGALAVLSCLDLVFDRLLNERPTFALVFFAVVAFAAMNLVLPLLWPMEPRLARWIATAVAIVSAIPLSLGHGDRKSRPYAMAAALGMIVVVGLLPATIPPVPLRVEDATFSTDFDRATLTPIDEIGPTAPAPAGAEVLFIRLEIFAPSSVPTSVTTLWTLDDEVVRTSREITITAHEGGFRIWDAWRNPGGQLPDGEYVVTVRTDDGRVFGRTKLRLE